MKRQLYFDDVEVTYTPTNIIQSNEYYPFGMQTAKSWTRQGNENKYLYNAGNELNEESGLYETFYREYDAALGRMMQVDPMVDKYASLTPYNYAFNEPVLLNDPLGDDTGGRYSYASYNGRFDGGAAKKFGNGNGYQDYHAGTGAMYGGSYEDAMYGRGGSFFENHMLQVNADKVKNGEMSHEDYGKKYGESDFYLVTTDDGIHVYHDKSFREDFSNVYGNIKGQYNRLKSQKIQGGDRLNFSDTYMGRDLADANLSSVGSLYLATFGTMAQLRLEDSFKNGMWKGNNGKWYSLDWGGNGATGARTAAKGAAGALKLISRGAIVIGTGISIYQGGTALYNGDGVGASKAGVDIYMSGMMTVGGPYGIVVGGGYFVIDATIGWDNVSEAHKYISEENQKYGIDPFKRY